MAAGFTNLVVRYVDVVTGRGVAVDSLRGRVLNAAGQFRVEVVPQAKSDTDGVYYEHEDLDVHDPAQYPGTYVDVEWIAERFGVVLPTFPKRHYFVPSAPMPADKTVLMWKLTGCRPAIYYEIWRERTGDSPVFVGRSFGPAFVDRFPFANEYEARSWIYKIKTAVHVQGALQVDGTDITIQENGTPQSAARTSLGVCLLEGRIADLAGRPYYSNEAYDKSIVGFRQYEKDRHQVMGDVYVTPEEIMVQTTEYGQFSVALLQDALAEMWIPATRFRARFIVPRTEHATLGSLQFTVLRE